LDASSIDEESQWICKQLKDGAISWIPKKISNSQNNEEDDLPVDKDDIIRFLELHHVQKLDVSIILFMSF